MASTPRSRRPRREYRRRRLIAAGLLVTTLVVLGAALGTLVSGGGSDRTRALASVTLTGSSTAASVTSSRSAAATTTATTTATHPAAGRPPPAAAAARHPGPPYRVGLTALRILRASSGALANTRTGSGQPARALPMVIRYPAVGRSSQPPADGLPPARSGGPYPLIVFSQGYDYPAEGYSALLDAWAGAGFVVADPTYPFTDPATPGGPNESDIVNHPADLRFVITRLLAAGRSPASPLHALLDGRKIALAGQSDGGDVTLATAANTCCRDARVGAAVILSGAELGAFGGSYYGSGSPPLLVSQGDADAINDPGCSAGLYDAAPAPKYYLDLLGAPHLPPYVDPGRARTHVIDTVISFLRAFLEHRPGQVAAMRRLGTTPGIATITSVPRLAGRGTFCPGAP